MESLAQKLAPLIASCYTGIWVETFEPKEAAEEIQKLCKKAGWVFASWDVDEDFTGIDTKAPSPTKALKALQDVDHRGTGGSQTPLVVVLPNFHRFLTSAEVMQTMVNQLYRGRQERVFLVVLSPGTQIPIELEKMFTVVDHPLPDREQLKQILAGLNQTMPDEKELDRILDAAAGLTRQQAADAFALSWTLHKKFTAEPVWKSKASMLRESTALQLFQGEVPELGGLTEMTRFCSRILTNKNVKTKPKGILALGVSGGGKSAFCKMLGHLVGRPTILFDIGALMGSMVGQTEAALRMALKQIDAMGDCVVMIDEVEKMISSGEHDGGVSSRILAKLLTWLNDREGSAFIVCTANDVSKMKKELFRAGRFDASFFVDLPTEEAKKQIWNIYVKKFELKDKKFPEAIEWTGAEIFNCCRIADLEGISLEEASTRIVPIARTANEELDRVRTFASRHCLDAEVPGPYKPRKKGSYGTSRNLLDDPPAGAVAA